MTIKTVEYQLPDFWLSPLFNGEYSGMSESDIAAFDSFVAYMVRNYGQCHAMETRDDCGFVWRHDASKFGVLACNCETVVFAINEMGAV